jgi:PIN domain
MIRTNYIFIDFENVHETDWDRIVGKPVKAMLILGEQHKYIPIAVVKKLLKCAGQVELIETKQTGKDAADIVLAQHIGEQTKDDPHGYYHIVSRDKGFDALITHLKGHGILAARRASFSDIPVLMNTAERVQLLTAFFKDNPLNHPKTRQSLESQIQALLGKALSPQDLAATVEGLIAAKVITLSAEGAVAYQPDRP